MAEKFRYIGVTDECTDCQHCPKTGLKSTVVLAMLDEDGNVDEITYYGSTCAARALAVKGGGRAVLQAARWAAQTTTDNAKWARKWLAGYGYPETGDLEGTPFNKAAIAFRMHNCNEFNPHTRYTWQQWKDMFREHVRTNQSRIAEAKLIGWQ